MKFGAKTKLGLYWGKETIYFVAVKSGQAETIIPISSQEALQSQKDKTLPEKILFGSFLLSKLGNFRAQSKSIGLSLPANDLMVRSFTIPMMKAEEAKNVVEFEAIKYIPLKLSELAYTFHTIPLTDEQQKGLRVLFVAIKMNVLQRYTGILEHAEFAIERIEPSFVSLVRALNKKGLINKNQPTAVIEFEKGKSKILILDEDVVQHVREIPAPDEESDFTSTNNNLLKDIRVSLDFYKRQNPKSEIKNILVVSQMSLNELTAGIGREFGFSTQYICTSQLLNIKEAVELGFIYAYGLTLADQEISTKSFELSGTPTRKQQQPNYVLAALVLLGCVCVAMLSVYSSNQMVVGHWDHLAQLEKSQRPFEKSSIEEIEKKRMEKLGEFYAYQDVRLKSQINDDLTRIPNLLPQGTWLTSWDFTYYDKSYEQDKINRVNSRLQMNFEGYTYAKNPNAQFQIINNWLAQLKIDEHFSRQFDTIELGSVQQENLGEYPVTKFKISCR